MGTTMDTVEVAMAEMEEMTEKAPTTCSMVAREVRTCRAVRRPA